MRILLMLQAGVLAAAQSVDLRTWQVRLVEENDKKISVTSSAGQVNLIDNHGVMLAIPAGSIYEIFHTTHRVRRSTKVHNAFDQACCPGNSTHASSHLLSAIVGALAAPAGSAKSHYVEIHWYGAGDNTVTLELKKDEYVPFMDWLQQISGTKWRDVERERSKALKRVEERAGTAFLVTMPMPPQQGNEPAARRDYLALPIDDNDDTHLYFFEGSVKPKNVVGILPVTRAWSINTCVFDVEVLYGKCQAEGCEIEAIMLPTMTYRVATPNPISLTRVSPESDSSCMQLKKQQEEGLGRYAGEEKPRAVH
jgi:hypothetical protein